MGEEIQCFSIYFSIKNDYAFDSFFFFKKTAHMKHLSFLLAASFLFLGCKKDATTPNYYYGIFEISNKSANLTFFDAQKYVYPPLDVISTIYFNSGMIAKANDSSLGLGRYINGMFIGWAYYAPFTDIDSPIHWQISGGKTIKDYDFIYSAPFPYYNITIPDTIHYHQGFSFPCTFTNADSVEVNFYFPFNGVPNSQKLTKTFSGNINSISFSSNYFTNIQDSIVGMSINIYNQHTELVNGNHYIFRKVNYVQASTIIVP